MSGVTRLARAKINLFLRVLGRREDGYHELESLVVPLSLADEVVCREAPAIRLHVADGGPVVSDGPDNLAILAALELAEVCAPGTGADIELRKRIPVAAGLGGGSADAAATLQGLNELWGCGLSDEKLSAIGSAVGSDVPALLADGASLVRGRGEILSPVEVAPLLWILVPFDFPVRTPEAFSWWDEDSPAPSGDPEAVLEAARSGDPGELAGAIFNDLEKPVIKRHPEIARVKERLMKSGAVATVMCGSGPTVAGLFPQDQVPRLQSEVPGALVGLAPARLSQIHWDEGAAQERFGPG